MLDINFKGLIFNVTKFSFADKETGEIVEGCKVEYLCPKQETDNSKGYVHLACNLKLSFYDTIKKYVGVWTDLKVTPNMQTGKFKIVSIDKNVLS